MALVALLMLHLALASNARTSNGCVDNARQTKPDLVLFQLGTVPSRTEKTKEPQAATAAEDSEGQQLSLAARMVGKNNETAKHASRAVKTVADHAQGRGTSSLATALGVSDLISVAVLALVILLALYFVWGGTWNKLEQDPAGQLRQTGQRAARTAEDYAKRELKSGNDPFLTTMEGGGQDV
eukprot:CAMPEP_0197662062 /NCGR_PEP_ID=MMETSP1338-20131121/52033_1 /TAXON_ID=43686 ORGANISM="Pelagodinium beii, Strain RCC1491" /NCGR_SAMPLE_ID=MMETSP1338 /ASSEMBLY_ACC=CAM_ASM_000754 /LENGTH=181 /DNA_ID=CAMNT_0043239757 /DNA_START=84 /DNA_END=630 /DNA_ORIENTATION=-